MCVQRAVRKEECPGPRLPERNQELGQFDLFAVTGGIAAEQPVQPFAVFGRVDAHAEATGRGVPLQIDVVVARQHADAARVLQDQPEEEQQGFVVVPAASAPDRAAALLDALHLVEQ